MKSAAAVRTISSSALLSYVYFNPIFQATRMVRKKLRRQLGGSRKVRWTRLRTL
jgi:hypothetical protein